MPLHPLEAEPEISVGVFPATRELRFHLESPFALQLPEQTPRPLPPGEARAWRADGGIALLLPGGTRLQGREFHLLPMESGALFTLEGVVVGHRFHWEHREDLLYTGSLHLQPAEDDSEGRFSTVVRLPLETYLESVVSSEMNPGAPPAYLRAHAILSRSWVLAQLHPDWAGRSPSLPPGRVQRGRVLEITSWTDREAHRGFDVCADDHCQRFHGVGRVRPEAVRAVRDTRGQVLASGVLLCDARFSKCCGGMSERFSSAWGDEEPSCIQAVPDRDGPASWGDLREEAAARAFILSEPEVDCNIRDPAVLGRLLSSIDLDTRDFFRWEVVLGNEELRALLREKLGVDPGRVRALRPLERGPSSRIVRLEIEGERLSLRVGKELEIRRILAPSHLKSSAFVVEPEGDEGGFPERFRLRGAGWGHGVGLCQLGAGAMALRGASHEAILKRYFDAELVTLYA